MIYKTREIVNDVKGLKLVSFATNHHFCEVNISIAKSLEDCEVEFRIIVEQHDIDDFKFFKIFIIPEENNEENTEILYSYFFKNKLEEV